MKEVMRHANWDAIFSEPARRSSSEASEHSISRTKLTIVSGTTVEQAVPALIRTSRLASFTIPSTFAADVVGEEDPDVDIHLQVHSGIPSFGTYVARSPLVGMTISRARAEQEMHVRDLTQNILIDMPIDTSRMTLSSRMLLAQQAVCVFWNGTGFVSSGCNVSEVSIFSATCSCNHLTMFMLAQDISIPACGDGVLQAGETCDDDNIYYSDGCSGKCTVEATWSCEGEPSKCNNHIPSGREILNHAGVRSAMGVSGYFSKEDFIVNQDEFVKAILAALGGLEQGIDSSHVVVIQVCYGNDCTTYYSGRRQLALVTEVDFQINIPNSSNVVSVLRAMASDNFLKNMEKFLSVAMGRKIECAYVRPPEEVITTAVSTEKAFEHYDDRIVDKPLQKPLIETDTVGLTFAVVMSAVTLCFAGMVFANVKLRCWQRAQSARIFSLPYSASVDAVQLQDFVRDRNAMLARRANFLKWVRQDTIPTGREIINPRLTIALESGQSEFTLEEWRHFGINLLLEDDFVKLGNGFYYKPDRRDVHLSDLLRRPSLAEEAMLLDPGLEQAADQLQEALGGFMWEDRDLLVELLNESRQCIENLPKSHADDLSEAVLDGQSELALRIRAWIAWTVENEEHETMQGQVVSLSRLEGIGNADCEFDHMHTRFESVLNLPGAVDADEEDEEEMYTRAAAAIEQGWKDGENEEDMYDRFPASAATEQDNVKSTYEQSDEEALMDSILQEVEDGVLSEGGGDDEFVYSSVLPDKNAEDLDFDVLPSGKATMSSTQQDPLIHQARPHGLKPTVPVGFKFQPTRAERRAAMQKARQGEPDTIAPPLPPPPPEDAFDVEAQSRRCYCLTHQVISSRVLCSHVSPCACSSSSIPRRRVAAAKRQLKDLLDAGCLHVFCIYSTLLL